MHIAEQQLGWQPEHTLSVAESLREAMTTPSPARTKSTSRRPKSRPTIDSPRDLPAPEPHLPLRKASAHGRMQARAGSVPKPLFAPAQDHRVRGFDPIPVQPPLPSVADIQASSEHAFAAREPRPHYPKAVGVLEHHHPQLQYANLRDTAYLERDTNRRPPSSPLLPRPSSERADQRSPRDQGRALKSSRSVQDGLRSLKSRMSTKHGDANGRLTPDSITGRPQLPIDEEEEVRDSFRSALTGQSSVGKASSINTSRTSISSKAESYVQVRKEDYEEGNNYSDVEDIMGMYENGFSSVPASAKNSLDIRSIRSVEVAGRLTPDVLSIRSLQLDRPISQPQQLPPSQLSQITSQPVTPTESDKSKVSHRRSHSAGVLIVGIPKGTRSGASPAPTLRLPVQDTSEQGRTSVQIACNEEPHPSPLSAHPAQPAVPRDRYGFKKASHHITVAQYDEWDKSYSGHIERRSRKWHALMKSFGLSTSQAQRFPPKSDKIKRYVRKGIPPEFRGAAWFWYAGGPGKLKRDAGLYGLLLIRVEEGALSDNDREHIERDLNRTFPDNVRFKPDPSTLHDAQAGAGGGISQDSKTKRQTKDSETPILKALRRVLQAFAVHKPQIGYCQSLNFIAGLLLLFLDEDEEKAFVLLDIVTSQHLPGTHGVALEGANIDIAVLMSCIKDSLPGIWAKLDDQGGMGISAALNPIGGALRLPTVSLATTAWFMSLFVGTLPIESVLRVWDCLFFEGSKTLFRIALAIFKYGEPQILKVSDSMEIFQVVQTIPRSMLDINGLMDVCFRRRGGFGGVSQGLVERRRAERRKMVKEGINAATADDNALQRLRGRFRSRTARP